MSRGQFPVMCTCVVVCPAICSTPNVKLLLTCPGRWLTCKERRIPKKWGIDINPCVGPQKFLCRLPFWAYQICCFKYSLNDEHFLVCRNNESCLIFFQVSYWWSERYVGTDTAAFKKTRGPIILLGHE